MRHHQSKYSVKAFKEYWKIRFEGKQWRLFFWMLATSTFAESL